MKTILVIASVSILSAVSPSFALSGGPFSNDSLDEGGGGGTYQGNVSGKNLIGIFGFAWSPSAGSTGRYAIFDRGVAVFGDMAGLVDISGRKVAGIFGIDLVTGSAGAHGGFEGSINHSHPILTFSGKGNVSTPASVQTTSNIIDTSTINVDSGTITDPNGQRTQITQVIESVATANLTNNDFVPIRVRGVRTSTISGTFSPTPLVGVQ